MKRQIFLLLSTLLACSLAEGQSKGTDTIVDVGDARLHFRVIQGKGVPILFDAGGGDDGTVWDGILKPLAEITGTTLITYDRAGFGQSQIVETANDVSRHGILNGIEGLEIGLKKLGYDGDIMLVSHSYGGFYSELYAFRHPRLVKTAVLIDANHACWFTEAYTAKIMMERQTETAHRDGQTPGNYYQLINLPGTVEVMRSAPFPSSIPVIDLVSENPPFGDIADRARWESCHKQFAEAAPNREGIVAYGSGHYIFRDNPALVINSIVRAYSNIIGQPQRDQVLQRGISYAVTAANESKRREAAYRHSEDDLNSWGYALLNHAESQKALDVFRLNVEFHPTSWNVYDSYGEALLNAGKKEEALAMYRKSVELNPKSEHGVKVIEELSNSERK